MRAALFAGVVSLVAFACGKHESPAETKPEAVEHHEGSSPERVRVSERVTKDAGVKVAPVEMAALPATVELIGEVAADPDRMAKVPARVSGRLVEVRFREGQRVTAGQVLAVIESSEVARVHAELSSTTSRADAARKRVDRVTELVKAGTASAQDLETARADLAVLEADVSAARQTLASMGGGGAGATARMQIVAPLAGVVMKRDGVVGQPVGPDHVLAEIVDLQHAVFVARLFENDLERVHEDVGAEVKLDAFPDVAFTGKVISIGRQVEPVARAVLARIAIEDQGARLKIGLFGTAHVVIPDPVAMPPWPVVPVSAVTSIEDRAVVFVEVAPSEFEARPVELGHAVGDRVEIVKGLKPIDRVAVAGLFTLKSLALKSTFDEAD